MKTKLSDFLKSMTGRYIMVGGSVYIFEIVVIAIAQKAGASSLVSVALSFWFGLLVSFFLQKLVTFRDKRMHHKVLLVQILAVTLLVLFNFGFTLLMTKLFSKRLTTFGARTLALGITTLWNFYLYRTRVFGDSDGPIAD